MADPPDLRQNIYQLPPIQPPARDSIRTTLPNLLEAQSSESIQSLSPTDSPRGLMSNRLSPPNLQAREGSKDRRISAACTACKKRKSKCTGGPPPCKLCRIAGIECVINESLDGRRKLAAKRVQDELQQHKALLDGLMDGLRSPEKTDEILELIRLRASWSAISDLILQPVASKDDIARTRVPIELLVEADHAMSSGTVDGDCRQPREGSASSIHAYSATSSSSTIGLSQPASRPGLEGDFLGYTAFVQALHSSSDQEAMHLLQEFRRAEDGPTFLQSFGRRTAAQSDTPMN